MKADNLKSYEKRYYYLKLHENYFKNPRVIELECVEQGHKCSLILLKLALQTLNTGGYLEEKGKPLTPQILSKIIGEHADDITYTIENAIICELIEEKENGVLFLGFIVDCVGTHTQYALEMQRYRERKKEKQEEKEQERVEEFAEEMVQEKQEKKEKKEKEKEEKEHKIKTKKTDLFFSDFVKAWEMYYHPTDKGSKEQSLKNYTKIREEGFTKEELETFITNYKNFVIATGNSSYIYKFSNFFGNKRYFDNFIEKLEVTPGIQALQKIENTWKDMVDLNFDDI